MGKKTIVLNPDFLKTGSKGKTPKTKKAKKKVKPIVKPNKLRKNLLDRVKSFKSKHEADKIDNDENLVKDSKNINSDLGFNLEFNESLNFLNSLSSSKKNKRRKKKELKKQERNLRKQKNSTLKTSNITGNLKNKTMKNVNHSPINTQPEPKSEQSKIQSQPSSLVQSITQQQSNSNNMQSIQRENQIKNTQLNQILNKKLNQNINLELPTVFSNSANIVDNIPLSHETKKDFLNINTVSHETVKPNLSQTISTTNIPNTNSNVTCITQNAYSPTNQKIQIDSNETINLQLDDCPPWGCIKNGGKPTYRQWKNNNNTPINDNNINLTVDNIKKDFDTDFNNEITKTNNNKNKIYNPRKIKRLRTVKFNLGKYNNKIGVLIKDRKTRKLIQHEHGLLKRKPILEIKKYLKSKNILKNTTSAPDDVLRHLYEQSILSGDIENKSIDNLLHNYLN